MRDYDLREVHTADYAFLKRYFSLRHTGTCENVITDAYLWKIYYRTKYFLTDTGLCWLYRTDTEVFSTIPLSESQHLQENVEVLERYFHEVLGQKLVMYLVDEEAVALLDLPEDRYEVIEDRSYFDYVYDAEALRRLSGKKYHKKKNHVNAFLKEYEGRYQCRRLAGFDIEEILDFIHAWHDERPSDDPYHRDEYEIKGIEYIIRNCRLIKYEMFGVFIDGKLEAFSLGTYDAVMKMAVIHVEKANAEIRGLYPFVNQQFLCMAFPEAELVNREDDMGLPGLRKAKESYHPVQLVKKYTVRER